MTAVHARTRRLAPIASAAFLLASALAAPALSQTVTVAGEQETFRQTPDGRQLGTVMEGTALELVGRQGGWMEVALEGWIWSRSVAPTDRGGFDLVVTAPGGENLRDRPEGRIGARLLRGFLLERVEDGGDWIRVRRTGWMWGPSLVSAPPGEGGAARETSPPATAAATDDGPAVERRIVEERPVRVHVSPEGGAVATADSGADLRILERRDGWARVRLEGWVSAAELATTAADSAVAELSVADLRSNPEQHVGRRVRWTVQFLSLERAEAVRADFYEGEPFLLARAPDPAHGLVYLAVPPELLERVEELDGLEAIDVLARVRTGRSALMGVPILDLLALY